MNELKKVFTDPENLLFFSSQAGGILVAKSICKIFKPRHYGVIKSLIYNFGVLGVGLYLGSSGYREIKAWRFALRDLMQYSKKNNDFNVEETTSEQEVQDETTESV